MHSPNPRIVIACTTYNHEKYIAKTLESFLMQQVNEPFAVYIQDDASTDNTQAIITEYQKKYPHIIHAAFQKKNLWQKGYSITKYALFPSISAEYVALCEGDDYFTDPLKIQKQVDFLDSHKEYAICFHPVRIMYDDGKKDEIFPNFPDIIKNDSFNLTDLLQKNFIQTNSCMYRWRFNEIDTPQKLIPDNILPCDHFWHLLHAEKGKIGKLDEIMSVYYRHKGGLWTMDTEGNWYINNAIYHLNFCCEVEKRYKIINHSQVKNKLALNLLSAALRQEKYDLIVKIKNYPEQVRYLVDILKNDNTEEIQEIIKFLQS